MRRRDAVRRDAVCKFVCPAFRGTVNRVTFSEGGWVHDGSVPPPEQGRAPPVSPVSVRRTHPTCPLKLLTSCMSRLWRWPWRAEDGHGDGDGHGVAMAMVCRGYGLPRSWRGCVRGPWRAEAIAMDMAMAMVMACR